MKSTLIAIALLTVVTFSYAQSANDLKGPAAKNSKSWLKKESTEPTKVYTVTQTEKVQGPVAKNKKAWEGERANYKEIQFQANDLQGPKAKNRKYWKGEKYNDEELQLANSGQKETSSEVNIDNKQIDK